MRVLEALPALGAENDVGLNDESDEKLEYTEVVGFFIFRIFCNTGIRYAAVLPAPVLARQSISFPFKINGIAFSCTAVGATHPALLVAFIRRLSNP